MKNNTQRMLNSYSKPMMQNHFMLAPLFLLLGIFLTPGKSIAIPYTAELNFETSGQSMWNTGSSYRLDETVFYGAEWTNERIEVGEILGSRNAEVTPEVCVLGACIPATHADTRTGIEATMRTSGKVGFEFGAKIDSGSVNAQVSFAADLAVPNSNNLAAGEFVQLNPNSTFSGTQSLQTTFPSIELNANLVLGATANFGIKGCLLFAGCKSASSSTLGFEPYTQELISLNKYGEGSIELLGGAVDSSTLLTLVSLASGGVPTLPASPDPADPTPPGAGEIIVDAANGFPVSIDIPAAGGIPAISSNLGNITLYLPQPDTSGGLDNATGTLKSSGQDDLVDFTVDVDNVIATYGFGTPGALGGSVNLGSLASVDYELINVELGPQIDLRQEFELTPTLMVDLFFDNPVVVAGIGTVTELKNQVWDNLAEMSFFNGKTTISPEFWLSAPLTNTTLLDVDINMLIDLLSADITYDIPFPFENITGTFELGIGNIFDGRADLFSSPPLFNQSFELTGFNRILGQSFFVSVPEPATLLLLATGLLGISFSNYTKRNIC